jgi:hypothetical protein
MSHQSDFNTALLGEVFTDMAENFFGARKQLEDMMELFDTYVKGCKENGKDVAVKAGFLNHLLLGKEGALKFYQTINADSALILSKNEFSENILPERIPFALTAKGEYAHIVLWAYDTLEKACHKYVNGEYLYEQGKEKVVPHYRLIHQMCEMINDRVRHVNANMPPGDVLQCVRKFTQDSEDSGCIAGAAYSDFDCRINEKLCYRPIEFDSLNLIEYPVLPPERRVSSEIVSFCKEHYSANKEEISKRISELKKTRRE